MVANPPTWTAARVALLKQLFERGRSCREIACEIGVSRNAVIGKISRLKLSRPNGRAGGRPAREAGPKNRRSGGARQLQMLLAQRVSASREAEPLIVPDGPLCTLLELSEERCRWPVGDACVAELRFCGSTVVAGFSYCAGHARIAYRLAPWRAGARS